MFGCLCRAICSGSKASEFVTDAVPHFHNKYRHFHTKKSRNPLAFFEIGSMLQINGREIFQRERVDKELSGEPETGLTERSGNRRLRMEPRKLLQRCG